MHHVACPSCGAEVEFRATTSVLAVCAYCRATVLKDAASVRDTGKMADLLEDYSPVRVGTSGVWDKRAFTVIGRQQLRYEHGVWSEWHVFFADGGTGWLGDFSGQYVMTVDAGMDAQAPVFAQVTPGMGHVTEGTMFRAADIRRAECIAGEGELPFAIVPGGAVNVVDYRQGARFLTLDWTDGPPPRRYLGSAVALKDLRCQFLRTAEEITRTAGRFRGAASTLACPNCGSALEVRTGMATNVVCPSCHADVDCAGDTAVVLAVHDGISHIATTLTPGLVATIDGTKWPIIGVLRMRETDSDEQSIWTEYLLFNVVHGFQWLVEADEGWDRVEVLDDWPHPFSEDSATWRGQTFAREWRYGSEVVFAAGAFHWRVRVGDRTKLTSFKVGTRTLTQERSTQEMVWTLAHRVEAATVLGWFGTEGAAGIQRRDRAKQLVETPTLLDLFRESDDRPLLPSARTASVVLIAINLDFMFDGILPIVVTLCALALLWLPVMGVITWDRE